jgi:hypothetical protein
MDLPAMARAGAPGYFRGVFGRFGPALPGDSMRYNVGDALGLCGWRIREASLP